MRHEPKFGGCAPWGLELGPHLTQCCQGRGLPSYQVMASWSIQPFGHIKHGPKIGGCALFGRGSWSPSGTVWPGPRPTSIPSGIFINAAVWPQQIWAENWGLCPFGGGGPGSPSSTKWPGRGLPACQVSCWSVQPFGHSTPTLQRGQTGQTDSTDNHPI